MLRAMRGAAETWIVKTLIVFLVISFSIWGVGDMFRGNPQQRVVACIGGFYLPFSFLFGSTASICTGERITVQELALDFQRSYDNERRRRGADFTTNKAKQQGMMDRVLRESAARKLFDHLGHDFSLRYDTRAVLTQLANTPELRTKDGKFDQEAFHRVITGMHMSEAEFINYMRETFSRDQSVGMFAALATIPQTLNEQLLRAQGQERLTQIIRVAHEKMPVPPAPDDAALEAFHRDNAKQFTAPEYRSIGLLKIMLDDVAKNITVSDADVVAAFDKRQSEFALGERRDILQVVVGELDEANRIAKEAQSKHELRKVAEAAKKDPVVLEDQSEETIPPTLYTTVFSSELNTISDPIKTDFGYHIVQVLKIKPPYKPVFADIKDKLRSKIQRERAQEAIQDIANKVDDELGGGKSLEDIAAAYQLALVKFPQLDIDGKDGAGKKPELQSGNMILQNAFGLNEGESSALLDDHRGNFLVVHVDKIIPPQLRPLAEVKDKVLAGWRAHQQKQVAASEADKIMAAWQAKPQGFAELSQGTGVSGSAGTPLSILGGAVTTMPPALQAKIIEMKIGDIAVDSDESAHYIARLTGFKPFDPTKNTEMQEGLKNKITKGWRGDVLDQLESTLRQNTPVRINQAILDEMRHVDTSKEE